MTLTLPNGLKTTIDERFSVSASSQPNKNTLLELNNLLGFTDVPDNIDDVLAVGHDIDGLVQVDQHTATA